MTRRLSNIAAHVPMFWRLQIMGWGGFMAVAFMSRWSFWGNPIIAMAMTLFLEPIGLLLSCALRYFYQKLNLRSGISVKTVTCIVVFSLAASLLEVGIAEATYRVLARALAHPQVPARLVERLVFFFLVFGGWSVAYLWLKAEFHARARQEQLREATAAAQRAELQMLRLQLNPHFLFNSLNNIASQIPDEPKVALEMTHRLAEYLRYSLDHRGALIVPLFHELEAVTTYLQIEQGRFGERLQFKVDAEAGCGAVPVPSFLLQPLVENAVKHGLGTARPPWTINLALGNEGGVMRIRVSNPGTLASDWEQRTVTGTGLVNLRRRLHLHYPGRSDFSLSESGGVVTSQLVLEGGPCPL